MFRLHKWGSSSCPVSAYLSNFIPSLYDSLNNSKWDVKIDRNFRGCSSQHCNLIDDTPFQVAWVVSAFRDYGFLAWHDKRWKESMVTVSPGWMMFLSCWTSISCRCIEIIILICSSHLCGSNAHIFVSNGGVCACAHSNHTKTAPFSYPIPSLILSTSHLIHYILSTLHLIHFVPYPYPFCTLSIYSRRTIT